MSQESEPTSPRNPIIEFPHDDYGTNSNNDNESSHNYERTNAIISSLATQDLLNRSDKTESLFSYGHKQHKELCRPKKTWLLRKHLHKIGSQ